MDDKTAGPMTTAFAIRDSNYRRWCVVFACFWLAVAAWGIGFYGPGVYLSQLRTVHGWSTGMLSLATTVYYIAGAVLVIFVGDVIARFGARLVTIIGVTALCLAMAALPLVSVPWQVFAAYLLMSVGWASTSWTAIPIILAPWFEGQRGLAISLAFMGASAGGIIVPPALIHLTDRHGFTAAGLIIAGATFALLVPLIAGLLVPAHLDHARSTLPQDRGKAPRRKTSMQERRSDHLRSFAFWNVAVAFALALTAQVGFLTHQVPLVTPTLGAAGAGFCVALTAATSIVGRLIVGLVVDRLDPRFTSSIAFAVQTAALVLMAFSKSPLVLYLACIMYGWWVGNIITLPPMIVQREFAPESFGTVVALVTAISQFTFAFGPAILGLIRDFTGSYWPALAFCAGFDAIAALLILARPQRHQPGRQVSRRE